MFGAFIFAVIVAIGCVYIKTHFPKTASVLSKICYVLGTLCLVAALAVFGAVIVMAVF
jgi:hypothetical protein